MVSKGKVKHLKWLLSVSISFQQFASTAPTVPAHMLYGMARQDYLAYCKRNGFKP